MAEPTTNGGIFGGAHNQRPAAVYALPQAVPTRACPFSGHISPGAYWPI